MKERVNLLDLFKLFFKLGVIGFGGPAAHIAMMEDEVVEKRKWLSHEHFLDLIGATSLIPGPNSTEMALHVGLLKGGYPGLLVAGCAFLFPAITLTGLLGWVYMTYGELPQLSPFLEGITPVVLILIALAVWKLGKKAIKHRLLLGIAVAVGALSLAGISEVILLVLGGGAGALLLQRRESSLTRKNSPPPASEGWAWPLVLTKAATLKGMTLSLVSSSAAPGILPIFLVFLKIGSILFGSGYVLIAFLEGDLVDRLGWLTQQQLIDAIAIGQFTPGPVLSTATFVGYQVAGWAGAAAATAGIFLPSFIFVMLLNPLLPKLRESAWTARFLDAVNAGALGLMAAVILKLGVNTLTGWKPMLILVICGLIVVRWNRVSAVWLVLIGAGLGYALYFFSLIS